jgi:4-hydroxy-tetrahydrodipicolinate reductase
MAELEPMRLVVVGAAGRMGRTLVRLISEEPAFVLSGAVERPGSDQIGADAGILAGLPPLGVVVTDDPLPVIAAAHGIVDFTTPDATLAYAELAAQARIVHVVGTTGLQDAHLARLAACARHCAVIRSGNMSLGVNLLASLVRRAAQALGTDWDIEITELHHRHKVDAPSGTALLLGEAAAAGRGIALAENSERGRDGITGPRRAGSIGFAALRGGSIIGEHQVLFAGEGEQVSFVHRAEDRTIFARGGLRAALWGRGRKPGLYSMVDVLGLPVD